MKIKNLNINNLKTREEIRNYIINEFLKEEPGSGSGDLSSKYRYNVEILNCGKKIYLSRPANLNKGMDFIVKVENTTFLTKKGKQYKEAPSHFSIINDLLKKKEENLEEFKKLFAEIEKIYRLEQNIITNFNFKHDGMPCDMLLNIIKWLFIEQDITYWNYSGRKMFMNGMKEELFI
ncbi:MAG: hypothetical protein PHY80_05170 [Rickettsiales bacterium]|nr:hypothetical protein [Rickettsiales bacterium]